MTSVAVITIAATFSEDYRMEERPVPVPGPGEVLVKVEAVGICAGDSKCFAGAARFWGECRTVEPPLNISMLKDGSLQEVGCGSTERTHAT